jgi:ParB family chromosome partitioning protein
VDLEKSLSEKIGLNVVIKNDRRNRGAITFFYKEIDQLHKIIEMIKANY